MHVCKKLALFIIVTFLTAFSSNAQVMSSGEELVYDVSYMGITLGTIRVTTLKNETFNGKSVHHTKIYIDSRKGIPFVDLHSIYESWIDPSVQFSHNFAASTK
ncbi:MAG: hypothetical protein ACKO0Y_09465, partial [Bacteroidota bacterium]